MQRAPMGEGVILLDAARNLAAGRGLCISDTVLHITDDTPPILRRSLQQWASTGGVWGVVPPNRATAFLPPLYPLLLSPFASAPGGVTACRLLGVIMGAFTVAMAFDVARRWVPGVSLVTAVLALADPLTSLQSAEISTHQAAAFTAMLPAWIVSWARPAGVTAAVVGILCGVAFLARPTAWLLIPLLGYAAWHRTGARGAALVVLGAVLTVAPWVARNAREVGRPLLLTTNGGRNLWEFNNQKMGPEYEWSEPRPSRHLYDPLRQRHGSSLRRPDVLPFPAFRAEPEWERDRELTSRFLTFASANPVVYAELAGVRLTQMLGLWPLHAGGAARVACAAHSLPLLLLSCAGAWAALGIAGLPRAIALFVMLFLGLHVLTAAGFTYRGMIDPFLAVLAGHGVSRVWHRCRATRRAPARVPP